MAELNDWMSDVPDATKLHKIIMPGSHDAGMCEVNGKRGLGVFTKETSMITQESDIAGQLVNGTRFFDLRVYNWGKIHGELYTGHFWEAMAKGKGDTGGYGQPLEDVLDQVKQFLEQNDSETVILKFSHMTHRNAKKVMEKVNTYWRHHLYRKTRSDIIPTRPMRSFRGKIIAMYDKSLDYDEADQNNKTHSFKSYKPGTDMDSPGVDTVEEERRIILWGEYSNTRHYDRMFADQIAKRKFRVVQWATARGVPHLYQLYWTLTGSLTHPNVWNNTQVARRNFPLNWPRIARGAPGNALCPNIVVYDFINDYQNALIVNVNPTVNIPIPDCPW